MPQPTRSCCWTRASVCDYRVPILWWPFPEGQRTTSQIKKIEADWFMGQSNEFSVFKLDSIVTEFQSFVMWWKGRFESWKSTQPIQKNCGMNKSIDLNLESMLPEHHWIHAKNWGSSQNKMGSNQILEVTGECI